jgi:hypothetical protein
MVIRRIREHAGGHNWFAVAIDLGIVIVGVFLGIQANNWNLARLTRDQARDDRAMLIDDLEANQQNLAMRTRYYQGVHDGAQRSLTALGQPTSALGSQFLFDAYTASQILPWSLKRNGYDQIQAGGRIGALGDAALRDKVTNFYVTSGVTGEVLAMTMPYHDIVRRLMPYAAQREIRSACNETIREDRSGQAVMILPKNCSIKLDDATILAAVRQVHDAPGLALDLNRLLVDLDQKLVSTAVISRRAAATEAALKRHSS